MVAVLDLVEAEALEDAATEPFACPFFPVEGKVLETHAALLDVDDTAIVPLPDLVASVDGAAFGILGFAVVLSAVEVTASVPLVDFFTLVGGAVLGTQVLVEVLPVVLPAVEVTAIVLLVA